MPDVFPNFIIVGVSRAGTTSMFEALSKHPQVCAALKKETRYFQAIRYDEPLAPLREYARFFRHWRDEPVVMECTPDYFFGGSRTAQAIKRICDPRIAIVFREPVSRVVSFYKLMRSGLQIPRGMDFAQYVKRSVSLSEVEVDRRQCNPYTAVATGQYARFLPAWLDTFPDACDILFFEDLYADPIGTLRRQCQRLNITVADLTEVRQENVSRATRVAILQQAGAWVARRGGHVWHYHPRLAGAARRAYSTINHASAEAITVDASTRAELQGLFAPWNDQLAQQLRGIGLHKLPGWLQG